MNQPQRIGKYELRAELGRGGFAVVYRAYDPALDREIALKVLRPERAEGEAVQRFLQEARQAARLKHASIAHIYDVDVAGGQPYIAMEYLPGGSLLEKLAGESPLPAAMALRILEEVAGALSHAHKKNLLHRDVKPANILFDEEERALLVDFGLVRSLVESGLTSRDTLVGTAAYMAPELWNQGQLGPAVDIYALGVVAYEMLVGQAPFAAETSASLLHAHLNLMPPDPRELNPDLDEGLANVLLKALAKDPTARYRNAQDFARALKRAWEQGQRAAATRQTLEDLRQQGRVAHQEERWADLVSLCLEIRRLEPDDSEAATWFDLGAARLAEQDKMRQQQKALEQAFAEAQTLLVEDPEQAVTVLEQLAEQGHQWEEVQSTLIAAREMAEKQRLHASMVAHLEAACYDSACTDLLAFLKLEPEHGEAWTLLQEIAAALVTEVQSAWAALEQAEDNTAVLQTRMVELETELTEANKALRQSRAQVTQQQKALRAAQQQAEQYDELLLAWEQRNLNQASLLAKALTQGKAPGATAFWARLRSIPQGDCWVNLKDGKEYVHISAGEFLYGGDKEKRTLLEYWIARTPVTNAEYAKFVADTGHKPPEHWKAKTPSKHLADHPVVYVNWDDAVAYAEWAGGRLPTEEEWEKAARGTDGRAYPWGNTFDKERCNSKESGVSETTLVSKYSPDGDSPYDVADMAGNVWEWTVNRYLLVFRVVRGGAFNSSGRLVRCVARDWNSPDFRSVSLGFRVVLSPSTL